MLGVLFLWLAVTVVLAWIVPKKWQLDMMTVSTLAFMVIFYRWSGLWLVATSLLVYASIKYYSKKRPLLIAVSIVLISVVFLLYRGVAPYAREAGLTIPVMFGLAYYTCRHIHILIETYKGSIQSMTLRDYLHYQFFLPVLIAGPIHRYHNFKRECERRRFDMYNVTGGLERILYGSVKVFVIGNYILNIKPLWQNQLHGMDALMGLFFLSAKSWISLYIQFSGYTDIALGFSLILGLRIEENFNKPYIARNLIDFWQRWHITLSGWCRDYVFGPVQAGTRNQLLAVFSAMVVLGLWHEVSLYYFIWGLYQALGIALCRVYQLRNDPLRLSALPSYVRNNITRAATFAWLVAGMPVITIIQSTFKTVLLS